MSQFMIQFIPTQSCLHYIYVYKYIYNLYIDIYISIANENKIMQVKFLNINIICI